MFSFQHSVTTKAKRNLAWETYLDWRRWPEFSDVYGQMHWRVGDPWEVGSCLEIRLVRPVRATLDHVVTSCVPGQALSWIDQCLGMELVQRVQFEETSENGTRINTHGLLMHSDVKIAGRTPERLVSNFTETWYANYRAACDRLAEATMSTS
jgi:hypothetical protein